jgi:hypothetical protein
MTVNRVHSYKDQDCVEVRHLLMVILAPFLGGLGYWDFRRGAIYRCNKNLALLVNNSTPFSNLITVIQSN